MTLKQEKNTKKENLSTVLYEGEIAGLFDRADVTLEKVGLLMAGAGESRENREDLVAADD